MDTLVIDGGEGEGGGQILRTSLTLSCITGRPLRMENIRAARRNPGLAAQHVVCVQAAAAISSGSCQGASLGSRTLHFQPGPLRGGDFSFDIGSAGSASLVLQTVMPALFGAPAPSTVTVTGGTHNPWAPPFDFLCETFLPAIRTGGFAAEGRLIRHGFFPAGGGRMTFRIEPRPANAGACIDLRRPGGDYVIHGRIYTARLPDHIAGRQEKLLRKTGLDFAGIEHVRVTDSDGPGNCLMIRLCGPEATTVFTAFGMRGRPSEWVVSEVAALAKSFLASGAAVDRFLADQLLLYMALSGGPGYTTSELSGHLTTNIETIKKFLPIEFTVQGPGPPYTVTARPS